MNIGLLPKRALEVQLDRGSKMNNCVNDRGRDAHECEAVGHGKGRANTR
jgi:hypothetical protein